MAKGNKKGNEERLLVPNGNGKLGRRIWTWGLPSGPTCPGKTDVCHRNCYSRVLESWRPSVAARYRRNLQLARAPGFARRLAAFIHRAGVEVVRVHVGGDFFDAAYARKWLSVMRACPATTFYFYTRSWRVPGVGSVLEAMSRLPNVRAWYSCDRDTGLPGYVPQRVRLAWLMAAEDDRPPRGVDLVFRVNRLRKTRAARIEDVVVCPPENGFGKGTTCGQCTLCIRRLPQ